MLFMLTTFQFAVHRRGDWIYLIQSFHAGSTKSLLNKFGPGLVPSLLAKANNTLDMKPIETLTQ